MYYTHFGLIQSPYKITPDTGAFFHGADRGDILNALVFAIKNGEAITKVVGEVGSGKTMLCRMLQEKLGDQIEIAYLSNPKLSPENVLPAIAMEFGLPIHHNNASNRLHVLKTLEKFLLEKHANNKQVVVLVEEAQGMPLESLEEIRLLSNLETHQHKLLQVVLFGQPELDDNLSAAHVRQIKDRITNSLYLPPIQLEDIREYLLFRLRHAGYKGPSLFSQSAVWLIAHFSRGLIRRINILADKALLAAYAKNAKTISWNHVLAARGDAEFSHGKQHSNWKVFLSLMVGISVGSGVFYLANTLTNKTQLAPVNVMSHSAIPQAAQFRPHELLQIGDLIPKSVPKIETATMVPKKLLTKASLFTRRRDATVQWMQTALPTDYSIQILLANLDSTLKIEEFLGQPEINSYLSEIFISQSIVGGETMFNVLYGKFNTFSKANEALNNLPGTFLQSQPYIRNMRDVQASS